MEWEPLPRDPAGRGSGGAIPGMEPRQHVGALLLLGVLGVLPAHLVGALDATGAEGFQAVLVGLLGIVAFVPQLGVAGAMAGRVPPTVGGMLRHGVRRLESATMAWLLYGNRVSVGLVLGVVPGVIWFVQGAFVAQAAALFPEDEPFAKSRAVVRTGHFWPALGLVLLSTLTSLGIEQGEALLRPILGVAAGGIGTLLDGATVAGFAVLFARAFVAWSGIARSE